MISLQKSLFNPFTMDQSPRGMLKFYESHSDGDVLTDNVLVISGQALKEATIK